jgi:hypothetical protein
LVRPRIDLDQLSTSFDHLTLLEIDLHNLAVDAAAYDDGVIRLNRAQPAEIDRKIGQPNGLKCDGNRRLCFGILGR